ncbi:MAG TPA: HAMP domain-containing sensor histidine kinase [Candidatus Saccharimonadales bacterium]|nr:HAMP domain-containing sensor histidine kinase [Candidatus Saccharimonadales bacterium]
MAVKIHDYFKKFRQKAILIVTVLQLSLAFLAAFALSNITHADFGMTFMVLAVINLLATPLVVTVLSQPFGKLSKAVAHVSQDPVITEPPKLTKADEQTGLKALVQTVYELAVASPKKHDEQQNETAVFKEILDVLPCGVIALGSDGTVIYANQLAPVSKTPEGKLTIDLHFEQNDTLADWVSTAQANKVRDSRLWLRVADKLPGEPEQRIFDVATYYQKGDPTGLEAIIVTFDRTNVYKNDQEDMDFIALAAHELRGPITVIRGYLDVFSQELGDRLDAEQKLLLERLEVSAERLSGNVNNILNVSRFDRKQLAFSPQEEKLSEIIAGLTPDLNLRARTQRKLLKFQIPANLPTIAADRGSLGEVITNLVDNAIKYSPEGGEVLISAAQKDSEVEFTVQDHGIGIPAAIVGNLFSRFYRSHRSSQAIGGTGLGLYICKAIVEMHGGKIWVRSVEGQGSTFGVLLPTYASVADKLKTGHNADITQRPEGWIKNHAMIRR